MRGLFEKIREFWCSGRDSDPGLRLERPEYLTGLYYRSAPKRKSITQVFFDSNKPYPSNFFPAAGFFLFLNKKPVICSTSLSVAFRALSSSLILLSRSPVMILPSILLAERNINSILKTSVIAFSRSSAEACLVPEQTEGN